jgi:putative transposase
MPGHSNVAGSLSIRAHGTRNAHYNVAVQPTADWTLQQYREALPGDPGYRYVIHDPDRIHSKKMDNVVEALGVKVLRTPVRAPKANTFCGASCALFEQSALIF